VKLADGKLTVIESLEVGSPKTKDLRKQLDNIDVDKTALLVANRENNEHSRNLWLSSRNLEGVELLSGHEVHPYHLLRYDRAIFARPAIEKLQEALLKSVPKRKAEVA
jgi:large subunit ribosomal protein L4